MEADAVHEGGHGRGLLRRIPVPRLLCGLLSHGPLLPGRACRRVHATDAQGHHIYYQGSVSPPCAVASDRSVAVLLCLDRCRVPCSLPSSTENIPLHQSDVS